jgi:CO dehydrogenase/acetyl-CoA synthase beta subunit
MELFTGIIARVRDFMDEVAPSRTFNGAHPSSWPKGGGRNIVLKEDLGLELGSPRQESVSCLLWTEDLSLVADGRVTLAGPDFPESRGRSLPFGKVVLAGVQGFDEDNAYARHKEMDFLRYDLDLKGFMLRAVSQYMREWCRISSWAIENGLNAHILGHTHMEQFRFLPYVRSVEIFYLTTSSRDVQRLREITLPAEKTIGAMNKMASEMDFDCESCDYRDVCDEADELKAMRTRLLKKRQEA